MSIPMRVAGSGRIADDMVVTWAVADGRKGRRWREVVTQGDHVVHSLLLETDADRRFSHLELARADGLWTLHPEGDGTLHGNHVENETAVVRHIRGLPFGRDAVIIVEASPLGQAALIWGLVRSIDEGGVAMVDGVRVEPGGRLRQLDGIRVERSSNVTWRVGEGSPFEIDEAGLPTLQGGSTRPLEAG